MGDEANKKITFRRNEARELGEYLAALTHASIAYDITEDGEHRIVTITGEE